MAREAAPTVELRGGSVDLVLVLAGRSAAAVEVTGPPTAAGRTNPHRPTFVDSPFTPIHSIF